MPNDCIQDKNKKKIPRAKIVNGNPILANDIEVEMNVCECAFYFLLFYLEF